MNCDLLVVGASFAGLACARAAAQVGLRVVLVEKKHAAGDKLHSTGIIVKDAVDSNPWLQQVPPELTRRVEGVRLYAPDLRHVDLFAPGYYFWATDTPGLLDWMAASVRALGVDVRCDTLFEDAQPLPDGWQVRLKDGDSLHTRYLVGADGPHSRVARALGLSQNRQFLYGVEREYASARMEPSLLHCFIDRTLAPGYIGWGVSGVHACQIGLARRIAVTPGHDRSRHVALDAFLDKIAPHVDPAGAAVLATRAGMIPCGGVLPQVSRARALLVGDAAGMVSPVTAGGIHTALRHGDAAGRAVATFARGQAQDPADWLVRQYPAFRTKRALRWLFDHFQADWMFNLMLRTRPLRHAAELVYFHRRTRGV